MKKIQVKTEKPVKRDGDKGQRQLGERIRGRVRESSSMYSEENVHILLLREQSSWDWS
jgi:hypothetical protein